MKQHTTFTETQKFTQWWLWLILIGLGLLPVFAWINQHNAESFIPSRPILISSLLVYAIILLFSVMSLHTMINQSGIHMQFYPFVKKKIHWEEVASVKLLNYGFVGGWGIRLWTSLGTVYNTKGQYGLAIITNHGEKLVIGTQKTEQLAQALLTLQPSKFTNELKQ